MPLTGGDKPKTVPTIKDSVHDYIEVEGAAADLLDTPAVQRLRRIKQLGATRQVYPSANHTRFEHSLGVYHLATSALGHLGVSGPTAKHVRAAAMLHDVGHGPYSHTVEPVVRRETGRDHDDGVDDLITRGAVGAVLRDHDLDPERIAGLIEGEGRYGQLIAGELNVDRMDYLVRDAHHTGVPYGTVDNERLVRELTFLDDDLALAPGNVQAAESLLIARSLMNAAVYLHHVSRITDAMFRRGADRLLAADAISVDELRRLDDPGFLTTLRRTDETTDIAARLDERRLYKRAVWAEMADVPDSVLDADHERVTEAERDVADEADLDPEAVIVDVPPRPSMTESRTRVVVNGEARRLDEQSPLVEALRATQRQQWRLGVYAPRDATERVGRAAVRKLGLDIDGGLVNEVGTGVQGTLDEYGVD